MIIELTTGDAKAIADFITKTLNDQHRHMVLEAIAMGHNHITTRIDMAGGKDAFIRESNPELIRIAKRLDFLSKTG